MRFTACLLTLAALVPAQDPQKIRDIITANDKTRPNALNAQCRLFTPAELAKYVGLPLDPPRNATGGCQWVAKGDGDGDGDVIVAVVGAGYHSDPHLAKGYERLPAVGSKGNVRPEMGGWAASAIQGASSVNVSVAGPAASKVQAVALLVETLKRVR